MSSAKTHPSSRSLIFPLKIVASFSAKIWGGGRLDRGPVLSVPTALHTFEKDEALLQDEFNKDSSNSRSLIFPLKIVASISAKIWGGGRLDPALCPRFQRLCIHLRRMRLCCKTSSTKTHPSSRFLIFPLKIVASISAKLVPPVPTALHTFEKDEALQQDEFNKDSSKF